MDYREFLKPDETLENVSAGTLRKRAFDKRKREEKALNTVMDAEAKRVNAEGLAQRKQGGKCFFGELEPGVNAFGFDDVVAVTREFARALGSEDVRELETLHEFEKRIFHDWVNYTGFENRGVHGLGDLFNGGGPFLNRKTQQLSPGWGTGYWTSKPFEETWNPTRHGEKVIDVAELPKLPPIKLDSKPVPTPEPDNIPNSMEI